MPYGVFADAAHGVDRDGRPAFLLNADHLAGRDIEQLSKWCSAACCTFCRTALGIIVQFNTDAAATVAAREVAGAPVAQPAREPEREAPRNRPADYAARRPPGVTGGEAAAEWLHNVLQEGPSTHAEIVARYELESPPFSQAQITSHARAALGVERELVNGRIRWSLPTAGG